MQKAHILHWCTINIRTEFVLKDIKDTKLETWGIYLKEGGSTSTLSGDCRIAIIKVENSSWEQMSVIFVVKRYLDLFDYYFCICSNSQHL